MKNRYLMIIIVILLVISIFGQYYNYHKLTALENTIFNMKHEINQMNVHLPDRISYGIENAIKKENEIFLSIEQSAGTFDLENFTYDVTFTLVPKQISETGEVFIVVDNITYPAQRQNTSFVATVNLDIAKEYQGKAIIRDDGVDTVSESDDLFVEVKRTEIFPFKLDFSHNVLYQRGDKYDLNYDCYMTPLGQLDRFKQMVLVAKQNDTIISEKEIDFKHNALSKGELFNFEGVDKFNAKTGEEVSYTLILIDNNNYRYEVMLIQTAHTYGDNGNLVNESATSKYFDGTSIIIKNPEGEIICDLSNK